jgi:hypothetical protein
MFSAWVLTWKRDPMKLRFKVHFADIRRYSPNRIDPSPEQHEFLKGKMRPSYREMHLCSHARSSMALSEGDHAIDIIVGVRWESFIGMQSIY